jgi:hypothetical protein
MSLSLDLADLSRAVGRTVSTYDVEAIDPHLRIHSVTGGVYRVRGGGFSLVVKIVRHGGGQLTLDTVWMLVRPDEDLGVLEHHVLPPCGVDTATISRAKQRVIARAVELGEWALESQP